jgi:hypothetical protein
MCKGNAIATDEESRKSRLPCATANNAKDGIDAETPSEAT